MVTKNIAHNTSIGLPKIGIPGTEKENTNLIDGTEKKIQTRLKKCVSNLVDGTEKKIGTSLKNISANGVSAAILLAANTTLNIGEIISVNREFSLRQCANS